jgi:thioredoxin reductase (NADPH)
MNTEITSVEGCNSLERITWRNNKTGETKTHPVQHVFVMAGASPKTEWLRGCVALDEKGFILTGRDVEAISACPETPSWPLERSPQMLETSLPGVFAAGDVRAGSVKRVASAVGEGAISIHMVHKALAQL